MAGPSEVVGMGCALKGSWGSQRLMDGYPGGWVVGTPPPFADVADGGEESWENHLRWGGMTPETVCRPGEVITQEVVTPLGGTICGALGCSLRVAMVATPLQRMGGGLMMLRSGEVLLR